MAVVLVGFDRFGKQSRTDVTINPMPAIHKIANPVTHSQHDLIIPYVGIGAKPKFNGFLV